MVRTRLDRAVVDRGLAATRSRARDLIARGCVLVNGAPQTKAGLEIRECDEVSLVPGADSYVSRGGIKLAAALAHFRFDASDRVAGCQGVDRRLHTGIARGGRARVCRRCRSKQLHPSLRQDCRVVSLEGTDARALSVAEVPDPVGALVADVSFIAHQVSGASLSRGPRAWLMH